MFSSRARSFTHASDSTSSRAFSFAIFTSCRIRARRRRSARCPRDSDFSPSGRIRGTPTRLIADAGAPPGRYDRVHGNHARRHGETAARSARLAATVPNRGNADDASSSERSAGADARERSARAAADAPREEDISDTSPDWRGARGRLDLVDDETDVF